jgi:hypothetical protein
MFMGIRGSRSAGFTCTHTGTHQALYNPEYCDVPYEEKLHMGLTSKVRSKVLFGKGRARTCELRRSSSLLTHGIG